MSKAQDPRAWIEAYRKAAQRRSPWESHWQECYDYALPRHHGGNRDPGGKRHTHLYDGTAADAVEQLAASLLSQLTPPWSRWFGLKIGEYRDEAEKNAFSDILEKTAGALQSHFELSNFSVEMHQCYLDLVVGGTACLLFEESPPGETSAFRFRAIPLFEGILEEDQHGRLSTTYRQRELSAGRIETLYPRVEIGPTLREEARQGSDHRHRVIEAVWPDGSHYQHRVLLERSEDAPLILDQGRFNESPFINFRWLKAPGEIYGRSPVMKCLPDIKTANKVVELILKNASIAVTGIWQAEDDGILNPANIRLVPGEIIPKAVGSRGLSPLESPGRFDVSQIVLDDLRRRIRHALLADRLAIPQSPRMSATEVLERSREMARILGASYGRLQTELLTPLIKRGLSILRRRGEIPDIAIDGRSIDLEYHSPLARHQTDRHVQDTILWLETAKSLGEQGMQAVDIPGVIRWLGRNLGVPADVIPKDDPPPVDTLGVDPLPTLPSPPENEE